MKFQPVTESFYDTSSSGTLKREISKLRNDIRIIESEKLEQSQRGAEVLEDSPYVSDRQQHKFIAYKGSDQEKSWKTLPEYSELKKNALKKLNIL